ncbi:hypothetical protein ACTXT7_013322 [Hymenolepis weldensis]
MLQWSTCTSAKSEVTRSMTVDAHPGTISRFWQNQGHGGWGGDGGKDDNHDCEDATDAATSRRAWLLDFSFSLSLFSILRTFSMVLENISIQPQLRMSSSGISKPRDYLSFEVKNN